MKNFTKNFRDWSVGGKITLFTFCLISVILAVLITMISYTTSSLLKERASNSIAGELIGVTNTVELFNTTVTKEAAGFAKILAASFDGKFSVDPQHTIDVAGVPTPTLKNGASALNMDFSIPDRFTALTGVTATIFVASGDDFIRISTSLKKENGERAIGTKLDHAHPGYPLLRAGQSYIGLATLFGKHYITQYDPIKDANGNVIGVLYVGVDLSQDLQALKEKIKSIKVGQTGYFFVLNAAPGKDYGTLVVHPTQEGVNALGGKDANGHEFIKEMLEKKNGTIFYPYIDPRDETKTAREKVVHYAYFKDWDWLIAGGSYTDEITMEAVSLRNRYILFGFIALMVFALLLFYLVKVNITRPLRRAQGAADQIASGDLTVNLTVDSGDEIGHLLEAMNGISHNLSMVVGKVRHGAEHIVSASSQIASGNLDLSARTESQANALAETASSMDKLTGTVKQNADHAHQANRMAKTSSEVAGKGGAVMSQVVDTMAQINESARKIAGIVNVIDGIAFQTNILALNAAVEAARAGEQGRGFAVVAAEVRTLAQRSAAAAKEIKTLIDDSVEKVDIGSKLVGQAGTTMSEVVESIKQVTGIMGGITEASEEQSRDIEQVNQAIIEMDGVTQQNAALVEQAAAAAGSMQDQAKDLVEQVRAFKLDEAPSAGMSAPEALNALKAPPRIKPGLPTAANVKPPRIAGKSVSTSAASTSVAKVARAQGENADNWEEF